MNNIIIIIIASLCAAIGGAVLIYFYLRPQLRSVKQLDEEIVKRNAEQEEEAKRLQTLIATYQSDENYMRQNLKFLEDSITRSEKQAKEAADLFYQQHMAVAAEHLEQSLFQEAQKYQNAISQFQKELQDAMEDGTKQLTKTIEEKRLQHNALEEQVADLYAKATAATQAAKRAEEIKSENNFYRIQLSAVDIEEIKMLRSVSPYLRDKEPLNKVIWKVYYEKPTSDMIGRVVGSGIHTGIYKITNIESGKCYVGQAANVADRWKQHIKRGVGADAPTRNKLYPVMFELGPENFTFEIIEECDRSLLDAREDYWQDFFKAKEFGYSIK